MTAFSDGDERYIGLLRKSVNIRYYPMESKTKEKVLTHIHDSLKQESLRNNRRLKWKRIAAIIPSVGLPLAVVTMLTWNHVHVEFGGQAFDWNKVAHAGGLKQFDSNYYDEMIPGMELVNLSDARAMNRFPIREPASIKGWTKVHSTGTLYGGVLMYDDFYVNNSGAHLYIQQDEDIGFTGAQSNVPGYENIYFYFFPGSKKLDGLGVDNLAAYTDMASGRSNLEVIHKEQNATFTDFLIYGYNVSQSELETIAHDYLQAPLP
jgi:hypothetical protein